MVETYKCCEVYAFSAHVAFCVCVCVCMCVCLCVCMYVYLHPHTSRGVTNHVDS